MSTVLTHEIADRYAEQTGLLGARDYDEPDDEWELAYLGIPEDGLTPLPRCSTCQHNELDETRPGDPTCDDCLEQQRTTAITTPLFECAGLNSCHWLLEQPGTCDDCQRLASDWEADQR